MVLSVPVGIQQFFLNMRSGIMHRYPAWESCNTDAVHGYNRVVSEDIDFLRQHEAYKRDCQRCKP